MARKQVVVSDLSRDPIPGGKGATLRISFADARKGSAVLDVTEEEAKSWRAREESRRGADGVRADDGAERRRFD